MRFNTHTHTLFSPDGYSTVGEYIDKARQDGVSYIAFTDHFESDAHDIETQGHLFEGLCNDIDAALSTAPKSLYLAKGIEIGFDKTYQQGAIDIVTRLPLEYIINSVHSLHGESFYYKEFFDDRTKVEGERIYLETVWDSLHCRYHYDAVGHLGFVSRNTPFADAAIHYSDHKSILDKILDKIISDQKILELNSSVRMAGSPTLPNSEILVEYKRRGGEYITFASDAHKVDRLVDGWDMVREVASQIGFKYYAIKRENKRQLLPI